MPQHHFLVDDHSLKWWHDGSSHDGHDQECGAERRVAAVHILQCDAVDGGEHERHEETDAHEAIEARHAHDEDGSCGA